MILLAISGPEGWSWKPYKALFSLMAMIATVTKITITVTGNTMTSTKFVAVFSEGNLRHLKFLWSMLKALDTLILSEHQPGMLCYNVELRNGEAKVSSSGPCYKFLVLVWSYKLINFRAHLQFSIFKSLSSSSSSRPSLSRGTQTVFVLKRGSPSGSDLPHFLTRKS